MNIDGKFDFFFHICPEVFQITDTDIQAGMNAKNVSDHVQRASHVLAHERASNKPGRLLKMDHRPPSLPNFNPPDHGIWDYIRKVGWILVTNTAALKAATTGLD